MVLSEFGDNRILDLALRKFGTPNNSSNRSSIRGIGTCYDGVGIELTVVNITQPPGSIFLFSQVKQEMQIGFG